MVAFVVEKKSQNTRLFQQRGGRGVYLKELHGSLHLLVRYKMYLVSVELLVHRRPRFPASRGHHFSEELDREHKHLQPLRRTRGLKFTLQNLSKKENGSFRSHHICQSNDHRAIAFSFYFLHLQKYQEIVCWPF